MKKIGFIATILLILIVSACNGGKKQEIKEVQVNVSDSLHPGIDEKVTALESSQINVDGVLIKIIGIDYGEKVEIVRKNDWKSSDNRSDAEIAGGSLGEGFAVGLMGSDKETKNMDGELIIYLEMSLSEEQRPKLVEIPIEILDDKETNYFISKTNTSFVHAPMSPEREYLETIKLKAYSDAKYFLIKIGDHHIFKIEAPMFKSEY